MGIKWIKGSDRIERAFGEFQFNRVRTSTMLRDYNDHAEPKTQKDAVAAFERFKEAVRNGKAHLPVTIDPSMTVPQFVDYYRTNYWTQKERSGDGDVAVMNVVARYFDKKPLALWNNLPTFIQFFHWLRTTPKDITLRHKVNGVWTVTRKPSKKLRSAKTISDYRMRVVHMVFYAKLHGLLKENPLADEAKAKALGESVSSEGRHRGVTEKELAALLLHADEAMTERLDVAVTLGPRRGEMQRAQLQDINFDTWTWTFPGYKLVNGERTRNTKNGKDRTIPIPPSLQLMFKAKRSLFDPNAFLFGAEGVYVANFKKAWSTLKRNAKLDDARFLAKGQLALHWHDLRGEAATRLLDLGVAPATVADICGNTVEVLLAHYKGDLMKSMRKATDLIGAAK